MARVGRQSRQQRKLFGPIRRQKTGALAAIVRRVRSFVVNRAAVIKAARVRRRKAKTAVLARARRLGILPQIGLRVRRMPRVVRAAVWRAFRVRVVRQGRKTVLGRVRNIGVALVVALRRYAEVVAQKRHGFVRRFRAALPVVFGGIGLAEPERRPTRAIVPDAALARSLSRASRRRDTIIGKAQKLTALIAGPLLRRFRPVVDMDATRARRPDVRRRDVVVGRVQRLTALIAGPLLRRFAPIIDSDAQRRSRSKAVRRRSEVIGRVRSIGSAAVVFVRRVRALVVDQSRRRRAMRVPVIVERPRLAVANALRRLTPIVESTRRRARAGQSWLGRAVRALGALLAPTGDATRRRTVIVAAPIRAVLPAAPIRSLARYLLETAMAKLPRFTDKRVGETDAFAFDLRNELASGETLSTVAMSAVVSPSSAVTDGTPSAILAVASPSLSGTKVRFTLTAGIEGCTYAVTATVTTNTGRTLQPTALLTVTSPTA